jgi:nucleotide-binding universal stress UspA family protein
MTITRILVPTDFSDDAAAALTYALGLARPFGAAVWSSEVYTAEIAGLQINLVRDAEQHLKEYAAERADPITTEVRTGSAARVILDFAREQAFDLIVMGTHGRTGLAHVVMGSVAERVARLSPCPVLTLRAETLTAAVAARRAS